MYLSRRIDGQARKVYMGRGPAAELAAELAEQERGLREGARRARQDEGLKVLAAEARLEEAGRLIGLLTWAVLVLAGHRLHRGCWRRRSDRDGEARRGGGAGRRGPGGG